MPAKTFSNDGVTIAYFGTLLEHRGTSVIRELLEHHPDITALCAGWSVDEPSQELQRHPRVRWLGVIPQREANRIIAKEADYILAIYPSDNYNNRFASPNKIFDAIHTRTPLICSDHIKLSEFVRENNLGLLVGSPGDLNYKEFGKLLKSYKGKFEMNPSLLDQYSWDAFEQKLLDLHAPPTARPQG
ncbi:hypothetical protein GCM10007420_07190 [Glycocaulis albus]|uniref:Glycosyltransferase n=2 Tax=Glycocaulis albus TaxID=1382801 RepID=A0ABQ1XI74_9PROT|nr:hypothetical protein GCM10007420_07190 [Glycocaulis albus]